MAHARRDFLQPSIERVYLPAIGVFAIARPAERIRLDVLVNPAGGLFVANDVFPKTALPDGHPRAIPQPVDLDGATGFESCHERTEGPRPAMYRAMCRAL